MMLFAALIAISATTCHASDGDTINCGGQRYRLLGIDAPELHGCRRGRHCVKGDARASHRSLAEQLRGQLNIVPIKRDSYGRIVAQIYASGANLACVQLRRGQAVYKPRWDDGGRLGRECPM